MAKTIREMAIQYAPYPANNNWNEMQKQLVKLSAYEAGANAVLEVIEKTLDLGEPPYLISVERAYYITKKLIRELRGE